MTCSVSTQFHLAGHKFNRPCGGMPATSVENVLFRLKRNCNSNEIFGNRFKVIREVLYDSCMTRRFTT